jgi:hypothetical protein
MLELAQKDRDILFVLKYSTYIKVIKLRPKPNMGAHTTEIVRTYMRRS